MPLCNRVTPFGKIVSVDARGAFTGNRGILHDAATRTLRRRWVGRRWIVCVCDFRGRRRAVMGLGSWTELFFLDEATALAAGHRPCFFCRRADAVAFRAAWAAGGVVPSADEMDRVLHAERLAGRVKRTHAVDRPVSALPTEAMVAVGTSAFVIVEGRGWRWSACGYVAEAVAGEVVVLTPPSTLRALDGGYRPVVDSSAGRQA